MIDNTLPCSNELKLSSQRKQLVESHLGLVVSIATRYKRPGVQFSDIVQEGNMGLIHASFKYDFSRGTAFSTYAAYWIQQTIERFLENQRAVCIPTNKGKLIRKRKKYLDAFYKEHGRTPTRDEILDHMGIKDDQERILTELSLECTSLDDPDSWNSIGRIENYTCLSESEEDVINDIDLHCKLNWLQKNICKLDPIEQRVLKMRYGIECDQPLSLRKVGSRLKLSGEGVRLIEQRALDKLRSLGVAPAHAA